MHFWSSPAGQPKGITHRVLPCDVDGSLKSKNESLAFLFLRLQISFAIVLLGVNVVGVGYSTLSLTGVQE